MVLKKRGKAEITHLVIQARSPGRRLRLRLLTGYYKNSKRPTFRIVRSEIVQPAVASEALRGRRTWIQDVPGTMDAPDIIRWTCQNFSGFFDWPLPLLNFSR
jgi:hypothetical protein